MGRLLEPRSLKPTWETELVSKVIIHLYIFISELSDDVYSRPLLYHGKLTCILSCFGKNVQFSFFSYCFFNRIKNYLSVTCLFQPDCEHEKMNQSGSFKHFEFQVLETKSEIKSVC
ncbi:hypothetical protein H1C71_002382 [Ictidomys tridecemlineatus]|nr:hypothetical protein H1C71_002382 [Ictidomys tridecemlineatus]